MQFSDPARAVVSGVRWRVSSASEWVEGVPMPWNLRANARMWGTNQRLGYLWLMWRWGDLKPPAFVEPRDAPHHPITNPGVALVAVNAGIRSDRGENPLPAMLRAMEGVPVGTKGLLMMQLIPRSAEVYDIVRAGWTPPQSSV